MRDCIVVGGGPAGLTAALYLARYLRSVLVFDAQDGRARMIPETHNLASYPGGISGLDFLDRMRAHAEHYGAEIRPGIVRAVEKHGDAVHISTDSVVETARSLILAPGVFNHRPPLSILSSHDHDRGLAAGLIRYCPVCDGYEIRGKHIAVLGGGEHGLQEANFIRHYSSSVTLIRTAGSVPSATDGTAIVDAPPKKLALSNNQVIVELANGETRHFDTLYVALGTTARTGLASSLGVLLGEDGCIAVDAKQRTNVDGIYAIGDAAVGLDQIATAIGHGAVAATAVHNSLNN